jgi:hypothetical protein
VNIYSIILMLYHLFLLLSINYTALDSCSAAFSLLSLLLFLSTQNTTVATRENTDMITQIIRMSQKRVS